MVCPICQYDAPYSHAQLEKRRQELSLEHIGIFPCPACGGTDYMLSESNIGKDQPRQYKGMLTRTPQDQRRITLVKQLQPRRSLWKRLGAWWRRRP